jgi:hypothetical protein
MPRAHLQHDEHFSEEDVNMNTKRGFSGLQWFVLALTAAALLAIATPSAQAQRDPAAQTNQGLRATAVAPAAAAVTQG